MKLILLIFFLMNLTNGFSQNGEDPFNLPHYLIKENRIKSITKYSSDSVVMEYSNFDQHGNEIYHEEEGRIIELELDYDEAGNIRQEVAIGYEHKTLLKKRPVYTETGKIDSIIYELPIDMYYSGFIEKYHYHEDGRIKTIDVYSVPENDLMFQHSYTYASGFKIQLLKIRTFVMNEEKSTTMFTTKFSYDKKGSLKKSSQLTRTGDTIAINFYGAQGRLLKEIVSPDYTQPSSSMYSSTYYSEALQKIQTPLTPFIVSMNLSRENYQSRELFHVEHEYDKGKLLKSTKSVKYNGGNYVLSSDTYQYNDQNKLTQRVTINPNNQDTTTVRYTYDETQRYIHLSENSRSYLLVKKEKDVVNASEELIIEAFQSSWECKTITDFDSVAYTVTKERFCKDSENPYSTEPEKITVASFDSSGRQIEHETFFGATKASRNTSYEYSENGELVRYESNGQYWKYIYDSVDSTLLKQENYADSTYEVMQCYYRYEYDDFGNYAVKLVYINGIKVSPFTPVLQKFDSDGRVLKKEWAQVEEYSARSISYSYNDRGLCVESVFSRWGSDEITKYAYEFY